MTDANKSKTITENQFWQCLGLVVAGKALEDKKNSLFEAFGEIVGKEAKDRYWDYIYDDNIEKSLKEHLPYDHVEVKWSKQK